jgi:hypothetical protein
VDRGFSCAAARFLSFGAVFEGFVDQGVRRNFRGLTNMVEIPDTTNPASRGLLKYVNFGITGAFRSGGGRAWRGDAQGT